MRVILSFFDRSNYTCQFSALDDNGQGLGYVECQAMRNREKSWGVIRNLAVIEQYRRQGIATRLITYLVATMFNRDHVMSDAPTIDMLFALVDLQMTGAGAVFEACGFQPVEADKRSALYTLVNEGPNVH